MGLRTTLFGLLTLLFTACSSGNGFDQSAFNKLPSQTPVPQKVETYTPLSIETSIPLPTATILPTPTPSNKNRIVFVAGLCSTNPKDTFYELSDWLVKNMGFTYSDFDYYNYAENGNSGEPYTAMETLKWIRGEGGSAQNFRNFLIRQHKKYSDSKFVVIAHSMGGEVTLYSLDQYPELDDIVYSVFTINSPVRGIDLIKANIRQVFPCVSDYILEHLISEHALKNPPVLAELLEDSPVIKAIMHADYKAKGIPVVTLANSNDPVLVSTKYSSGVLGTLPSALNYIYSFGINPDKGIVDRYKELAGTLIEQHILPLLIESLEKGGKREAAEFMGRALRCAIIGDNCTY